MSWLISDGTNANSTGHLSTYDGNLYYNQDTPEISDYEYDQLMIRLKEIEKEHPDFVTKDSPSQIIGGVAKRTASL